MAPRGATGRGQAKGCRHTMQQGFDPPRAFPTGICEIGSWPQTNFLVTLSCLPDSVEAAYPQGCSFGDKAEVCCLL